jgi:two-component system nitrate/nitrite response regulator NarL
MVIEPRSLVREALVSLMVSHSYHIVGDLASPADIDKTSTTTDAPRLVILSALPVDEAACAATHIRELWPEAKVIFLFERASSGDFQKLLASEIDGCIPLFASPDTLVDTLQSIVAADLRILVLKTETCSSMPSRTIREEADAVSLASHDPVRGDDVKNRVIDCSTSLRLSCGLSQREEEILKGVVKGLSNKMIARTCGVTDATIKVHMKSILRKIRVANRTQAAIWALEQGYGAEVNRRPAAIRPAAPGVAAA